MSKLAEIENELMRRIDRMTEGLSGEDYREFLDWLGSEADARLEGLDSDEAADADNDK